MTTETTAQSEPSVNPPADQPSTLPAQLLIELLNPKAKLAEVVAKLNEVIEYLNTQGTTSQAPKARDRGPDSERDMTEEDAKRILLGDLKDTAHKDAAKLLNLSYGQIYSARKGFTFKTVYKMFRDAQNVVEKAAS